MGTVELVVSMGVWSSLYAYSTTVKHPDHQLGWHVLESCSQGSPHGAELFKSDVGFTSALLDGHELSAE